MCIKIRSTLGFAIRYGTYAGGVFLCVLSLRIIVVFLCAVFRHLVCVRVSAVLFYTIKKSGKTSKKSDSAAGTAAASSRSTSSSSKSIVSPRITTSSVSQTFTSQSGISQSSNIPVHRSVSGVLSQV